MKEKLRLNKQGYKDYLKAIEKKEKELADLRMYKGKDAIYQGDNWHDNPTLYQAELQELSLMKEISAMKEILKNNVEIIENLGDENLIDIGDIVRVNMIFSEFDKEEDIYRLVATDPDFNPNSEVQDISINSPLGTAMYHKKIGDTASYKVEENTITIELKEKLSKELLENKKLRKTR